MSSSWSASTASGIAASVGMPACSMNTSCVAAVPPCMPSSTITSAPDLTASATSKFGREAPIFTKIGFFQSVISRSSPILISRSSGPVQSGCRQAQRWSIPSGRSRIAATRAEIFWPSSIPPPPGLAPWPMTTSMASQRRRSSGFMP